MQYQKPEISIFTAVAVIQGTKGYYMTFDNQEARTNGSGYEADE